MPREFQMIQSEWADEVDKVKKSQLKSRGRRWYKVTWPTEMSRQPLSQIIDQNGSYNIYPYAYTPPGILPVNFYTQSSDAVSLQSGLSLPTRLQISLAEINPSQLLSVLEKGTP